MGKQIELTFTLDEERIKAMVKNQMDRYIQGATASLIHEAVQEEGGRINKRLGDFLDEIDVEAFRPAIVERVHEVVMAKLDQELERETTRVIPGWLKNYIKRIMCAAMKVDMG